MPDEGQTGSGAARGAAPAAGSAPPAASAGAGVTPSPAPATFDWKTSGLDDAGLSIVTERGWKAPGDLLTSYRNLETAVGVPPERLIKLPAERDAGDPKVWEPIWSKLGKPASADKYTIPIPEGDKGEFAKVAKEWFHGANMTQAQATALATKWNEHIKAQAEAHKTETENQNLESVKQLKGTWGSEYEKNAELVDQAAEKFGMTQEQLNALKQTLSPKGAMEFLYNIGKSLGVEAAAKGVTTEGRGADFATTPQQAAAELARMKADPTFAKMFNSEDPKVRAETRAKIDRLAKLAAPGMSAVVGT